MKNISTYIGVCFLILASVSFNACKKSDSLEEFVPDRMFTPAGDISSQSGETSVKLTWKKALHSADSITYTVEISKDTLFVNGALFSLQTDTTGVELTDEELEVREKYFARVRTNAWGSIPESNWIYSSSFQISGEQLFFPINQQLDLKDKTVVLKWRPDPTVTHLIINEVEGEERQIDLTAEDIENGTIKISGLTAETPYEVNLLAGEKSKGIITFTTKAPSLFTVELTTEDDIVAFIDAAQNNDIIGLDAGTYDLSAAEVVIMKKHLTIASISGNPNDTKILAKGFMIRGDGAGIHLRDLTVDGGGVAGTYMLDLRGETSDGGAAEFTSITIQGSIVQNWGRAALRGTRGGNRVHNIDFIRVENTVFLNNDSDYALFEIQKLGLNRFEMVNSTINRLSTQVLRYDTNIGQPAAEILFDHVTINAFGNNSGKRALVDVNTPANIVISNSIIANTGWVSPRVSSPVVHADLLRAGNGATITIQNTNMFNLTDGKTPAAALNIPSHAVLTLNHEEVLPWTYTTDELTIPAGSPLLQASSSGGAIGDPRWTLIP